MSVICGLVLKMTALTAVTSRTSATKAVTVIIDPAARRHKHGLLVGAGIEDVNNELYGGLYSQMVYGESFEEPASNGVSGSGFEELLAGGITRPTWMPWSQTGEFSISGDAVNGNQSQLIKSGAIANFGLGQQGMHFKEGHSYVGHLFVKAQGDANVTLQLISSGRGAREVLAFETFFVPASKSTWSRLEFSLVPSSSTSCAQVSPSSPDTPRAGTCGYFKRPIPEIPSDGTPGPYFRTCYQCSGGLVVEVSGGAALVDMVFLQPGNWGLYKGLPVRRDVAETMFDIAGWQVLRLGGTMVRARAYRWKHFRGPRWQRFEGGNWQAPQPWQVDAWHPFGSPGFRIFEALELCEAADATCAITMNCEELAEDMADFVEYCFGDESTKWGRQRLVDGRRTPYKPFVVEIGNEQGLTPEFVSQVRAISKAVIARAEQLDLGFPLQIAVGQNIGLENFNASSGALNVTRQMLDVLKPLGSQAAWDAHIGGDSFSDSDDYLELLHAAQEAFSRNGSEVKLVVFEENGNTHNLQRALVHTRMHIAASYFGGFLLMEAAANGLQVFAQNDNAWDQGQIFMTPDKVWLSPFGWTQSMLSWHAREFNVPVNLSVSHSIGLDVGAYLAPDSSGSIGLRAVNWSPEGIECTFSLPWKSSSKPSLETTELTSANLSAVNPPQDPTRVSPHRVARGSVHLANGWLRVTFPFVPHSFVTMVLRQGSEEQYV